MNCRHCGAKLTRSFVDLGSAPPSNAYLDGRGLKQPEKWFPLRVMVCQACWLVQTEDFADADELFSAEYAYFSSYSASWLEHAEGYAMQMQSRFGLDSSSHVVEIAANDGYLLQYFEKMGIPNLGVEPTASTAAAARLKGIDIVEEFFGVDLARKLSAAGKQADLMAANNVLAHVPDINDFVAGFAELLKPNGVATFEFPHLLNLVTKNQFDTIYHEHYSYLSLSAVARIFERNGLNVFDVEEIPTHGGSLRVYAQRADTLRHETTPAVAELLNIEQHAGLLGPEFYSKFQEATDMVKDGFLRFLLSAKAEGKSVAAYGAAAKGNTLMNYAGVRPDLIQFVVDLNPAKQGQYMPGSRIPIVEPERIAEEKPDYLVILPWNLSTEIMAQMEEIRSWGGQFVTAVPELSII